MMSEKSDIEGEPSYSLGGETGRMLEEEPSQRGHSNAMIFMAFFGIIVVGFVGTLLLAIAPTLLPLTVFMTGAVLVTVALLTLGFSMFQRLNIKQKILADIGQTSRLIKDLTAQNLSLKSKNKTLKRLYQEELLRAETANSSKTAFLAHLSHDIRTPLNHIIGFADLVSHQAFGPLGDKRYLTYVRDIKKSGEGLLSSVADILELAELQNGQRILNSEDILVADLLKSLQARFCARAKRCKISLEVETFCAVVLQGDRMGYERLLENLLDNAFKFTRKGGKIRLAAWVAEDGVVLEVTDSGIGIHKDRLQELLEPFSHETAIHTKNRAGMGLGLAIARSLAELSGGELAIDSTPSIGTTVAVSLPLAISQASTRVQAA